MRFVKSISLFFVYSVCLCVLGFWMGMNYNYDLLQEEDDNRFELYGQGNIIDDKTKISVFFITSPTFYST